MLAVFCFTGLLAQIALADQAMWRYTVRPGDNLITLGKKHLINPDNWKEMQRLNRVKNPYRMPVGKVLHVPIGLVKQGPAKAEVIFVSGQAQLQMTATEHKPLLVGEQLGAGAKINTNDNSKVVIQFADGTTTELASNSQLKLDSMSLYSGGTMVDTRMRLQKGRLQTNANPKHEKGNRIQVITPSAIAAVRGTKFRVNASEKIMVQETLEGSVALAAQGKEVAVNRGFGSKVEKGKPPIPPVVLLPAANTSGLKKHYQRLPLTFELPEMAGAMAWVGKIGQDVKMDYVVAEEETQDNRLTFADIADGEYFLNLRAKDANGIAGYDASHAFTINARPVQPNIISAAVVREPRPQLQWETVVDADVYAVDIAADEAFQQVHESIRVNGQTYQLQRELEPGAYYLRVTSITKGKDGKEDIGPAFNISRLTYKPIPPKPDISQLVVKVVRNRVLVNTTAPLAGMTYDASLDNEFNDQENVWQGRNLGTSFDFLLKEYGKQTLYIKHVDRDGVAGPAAVYEFYAHPE